MPVIYEQKLEVIQCSSCTSKTYDALGKQTNLGQLCPFCYTQTAGTSPSGAQREIAQLYLRNYGVLSEGRRRLWKLSSDPVDWLGVSLDQYPREGRLSRASNPKSYADRLEVTRQTLEQHLFDPFISPTKIAETSNLPESWFRHSNPGIVEAGSMIWKFGCRNQQLLAAIIAHTVINDCESDKLSQVAVMDEAGWNERQFNAFCNPRQPVTVTSPALRKLMVYLEITSDTLSETCAEIQAALF